MGVPSLRASPSPDQPLSALPVQAEAGKILLKDQDPLATQNVREMARLCQELLRVTSPSGYSDDSIVLERGSGTEESPYCGTVIDYAEG